MENNTNTNYTGPTSTASSSAEGRLKVGVNTPKPKITGRRALAAQNYKPGPVTKAIDWYIKEINQPGTTFSTMKEMAKVGYNKLGNKVMEMVDGKPEKRIVPSELSQAATTTKKEIVRNAVRRRGRRGSWSNINN